MRLFASLVLLVGCGTDAVDRTPDDPPLDPEACETETYLRYDNFAAGFSADWCRGCHSSAVPEGGRQDAPLDVNFDTEADLVKWRERILVRATGATPTMPPAGGPSEEERQLLREWIDCGMP
jgi:uncharacterized membrane protein